MSSTLPSVTIQIYGSKNAAGSPLAASRRQYQPIEASFRECYQHRRPVSHYASEHSCPRRAARGWIRRRTTRKYLGGVAPSYRSCGEAEGKSHRCPGLGPAIPQGRLNNNRGTIPSKPFHPNRLQHLPQMRKTPELPCGGHLNRIPLLLGLQLASLGPR